MICVAVQGYEFFDPFRGYRLASVLGRESDSVTPVTVRVVLSKGIGGAVCPDGFVLEREIVTLEFSMALSATRSDAYFVIR
jgi:hypothetical protein